jgi:hypothetical protein
VATREGKSIFIANGAANGAERNAPGLQEPRVQAFGELADAEQQRDRAVRYMTSLTTSAIGWRDTARMIANRAFAPKPWRYQAPRGLGHPILGADRATTAYVVVSPRLWRVT